MPQRPSGGRAQCAPASRAARVAVVTVVAPLALSLVALLVVASGDGAGAGGVRACGSRHGCDGPNTPIKHHDDPTSGTREPTPVPAAQLPDTRTHADVNEALGMGWVYGQHEGACTCADTVSAAAGHVSSCGGVLVSADNAVVGVVTGDGGTASGRDEAARGDARSSDGHGGVRVTGQATDRAAAADGAGEVDGATAVNCSGAVCGDDDGTTARFAELEAWLIARGANMSAVHLAPTAMGTGVVATRRIATGERLFTVTPECRITAGTVTKRDPVAAAAAAAIDASSAGEADVDASTRETAILIAFLVHQEFYCEHAPAEVYASSVPSGSANGTHADSVRARCPWLPYTHSLPRTMPSTPSFYRDPVSIELVRRVPILDTLRRRIDEAVAEHFVRLRTAVFTAMPAVFGPVSPANELLWRERVKWAFFVLSSRAYAARSDTDAMRTLIPLADAMNHQNGVNHLQHVVGEDGRLSHHHIADRDYEPGDEVWASYDMEKVGFKKCNHELLFQYGFVVDDPHNDCVKLSISISHASFDAPRWRLLQQAGVVPGDVELDAAAGGTVVVPLTLRLGSHLPDALVWYFRINNLLPSEYGLVHAALETNRLVSLRNELVAIRSLLRTFRSIKKGTKQVIQHMLQVPGLPADRALWKRDWVNMMAVEEGVCRALEHTLRGALALWAPVQLVWTPAVAPMSYAELPATPPRRVS